MVSRPSALRTEPLATPERQAYEAPCLLWEEDFEPAGQTTGCADVGENCPERPEV